MTIVNQLTTTSATATVPSTPVSPVNDELLFTPLWTAKPNPTPPTSSTCGIARTSRSAVVSRLRSAGAGVTLRETGYAIADIIMCDDPRRAYHLSRGDYRRVALHRRGPAEAGHYGWN